MPRSILSAAIFALLINFSLVSPSVASIQRTGFQWMSPEQAARSAPPAMPPRSMVTPRQYAPAPAYERPSYVPPRQEQYEDIVSPTVIEAPVASAPVIAAPVTAPTPVNTMEIPASAGVITDNAMPAGDVLQGFGTNVPLAVAVKQVLPKDYTSVIDPSLDMGKIVSWKGGKSWRDVMQDLAIANQLMLREEGQMVYISGGNTGNTINVAPVTAASVPAMEIPVTAVPAMVEETAPAMMDMAPSSSMPMAWMADRGQNLREVLQNWSQKAGVDLAWQNEYDFPLQASFEMNGSFEEAVRNLLSGFESARPQPIGRLHKNAASKSVLVIETRGNNYSG
jgi:Toxin co-regulated pilus biosynthesis protein Q